MIPCTQCGRCCTNENFMGSLAASGEDVRRWRKEGRGDILEWVWIFGDADDPWGDLWINSAEHEAQRCPFVRKVRGQDKYVCRIYETRPAVCRAYPQNVEHMKAVNCEMLEPGDTDVDIKRGLDPILTT